MGDDGTPKEVRKKEWFLLCIGLTKKACSGFSIRSYRKTQIFVSTANNLWLENSSVAHRSLTLYELYQCTQLALIRKLIDCPPSRWWAGRLGNLASRLERISLLLGNQNGPTTSLVHHTSVYLIAIAYKNGSGTVELLKEVGEKITAISLLSLRPKSQHFSLVIKTYCTHSFLER